MARKKNVQPNEPASHLEGVPPELQDAVQKMMTVRAGRWIEIRTKPPLAITPFDIREMLSIRKSTEGMQSQASERPPEPHRCRPNRNR